MNYAYEIRRQAEAAPCAALPAVAVALWQAFGEGKVSEAEAEALSGLIEARTISAPPRRENGLDRDNSGKPGISGFEAPRSRAGSRPRTDASMARRRRWAASGRLPPALAARFTLAEQAVLAVVAVEVAKRGDCRLCHEHVAAAAGVSRSTVKAALRQARALGLMTIEERRLDRFRNDTNIVRIVSAEWTAWLRLARRGDALKSQPIANRSLAARGGIKFATGTNTPVPSSVDSEAWRARKGCRGREIGEDGKALLQIHARRRNS